MNKLMLLIWLAFGSGMGYWTFRTALFTTSCETDSLIHERRWFLPNGGTCGYTYKSDFYWQAVIEYRWPVWDSEFPTKEAADKWVSHVCR